MHKLSFSDSMKLCSDFIGINTINGPVESWNAAYRAAKDSGFNSTKGFIVVDPANCWLLSKELRSTPEKVARKLGADDRAAQAIGAACRLEFMLSEAAILLAVKKVGSSCVSADYQRYRYYTRAKNARFAVATLGNTRCLVRMDTMSFVVAYGEEHYLLERALELLGYERDESWIRENSDLEVVFPSSVREYRKYSGVVESERQYNMPHLDFYLGEWGKVKCEIKYFRVKVKLPKGGVSC